MAAAQPIPPVRVAGLLVPAALAPRIVAALRATYPALAADKPDDAVVRAVLHYWITSTLESYETQQAATELEWAKAKLAEDYDQTLAEIRQAAQQVANAITEDPTLTPTPTTETP